MIGLSWTAYSGTITTLSKQIPAEANARNNRRVFFVFRSALVATQRCFKQIPVAVNQHATIDKAVLSAPPPRLYNEDVTQLELRSQLSPGVGSWQNN
jgi:hypothetical protein